MGMFDALFGGGGGNKAAHGALRNSMFNPYNLSGSFGSVTNTPGFVPNKKEWRQGMRPTPGTFSANLDPAMEELRNKFLGAASSSLDNLGQGAGGYLGINPELFSEFGLSNQYEDMSGEFMDASRGYLAEEQAMGPYDFDKTYADRLGIMRQLDAPLEERERLGSIESQFGKGVLASTAGSYQTEGLERALAAKDLMRHQGAFGQAMGLGDQFNQIRQMLQNAGINFGQAGADQAAGRTRDRFARAMGMFGAGQEAEHLGASRAGGFLGGAGSIDQFLANLMQTSGNLGSQQSGANAQAWQPYVQSKMASDQFGMDFLGQLMSSATIPFGGGGAGLNMPGRAFGGPINPGQPYMVGEFGPEVVMPQQPGMVMPNPNTPMLAGQRPMPFEGKMPGRMPGKGGYMPMPFNPMNGFRSGRGRLGGIFSNDNRYA